MNGYKVTKEHVATTSDALNVTLPIQKSIEDLRISRTEVNMKLVEGTYEDARKIANYIEEKVGFPALDFTESKEPEEFDANFWYPEENDATLVKRPSDVAEAAYNSVWEYFLKHQDKIFTNGDPLAEEADEPEDVDINLDLGYEINLD